MTGVLPITHQYPTRIQMRTQTIIQRQQNASITQKIQTNYGAALKNDFEHRANRRLTTNTSPQ